MPKLYYSKIKLITVVYCVFFLGAIITKTFANDLGMHPVIHDGKEVKLVFDLKDLSTQAIKNFRIDPIGSKHNNKLLDLYKISRIRASGSGQFSEKSLLRLIEKTGSPLLIVDLRQETHGFINGIPVSLYADKNSINKNLSVDTITEEEQLYLNLVKQQSMVAVYHLYKLSNGAVDYQHPILLPTNRVETEEQLLSRYNILYHRIFVTDRHHPQPNEVDNFLKFLDDIPQDAWLHFHCRAGKGRTTTFMVMLDILRGHELSLEEIFQRHYNAGGANLSAIDKVPEYKKWTIELKKERKRFFQDFYSYVAKKRSGEINSNILWSEWIGNSG